MKEGNPGPQNISCGNISREIIICTDKRLWFDLQF